MFGLTFDLTVMMVVSHNNKCFGGSNPEHAEYGLHAWAVSLQMDHYL